MKWNPLTGLVAVISCLSLVAAGCSSGSGDGDSELADQQLVFVNWGGQSVDAAKQGWLDPFTKKTGVEFAQDSPTDNAKIKTMVTGGKTTWDVVDTDVASGGSECGTLFEERPADFDMSEISEEYISDDCGVPIIIQAVALVYNKEAFGDAPPTSATDFMDTETYPGKRLVFNYPVGSAEPLLMADGALPDEIFPIDWNRINDIFSRLGNDLEPKDSIAQMDEMVQAGDFAMCFCYLGRLATLPETAREKIGIVWDKTYLAWDGLYAVKGSESPEAQMEFMQFLATAEGQKGYSEHLAYSPTTKGGLDEGDVSEGFQPYLPDFNQDKIEEIYNQDAEYWTENIGQAMDDWTSAAAG
ncbi:extracellular solute-binding protein [Aeromicrobium sp. CTD01-1L150]|uniref:extracellular solute-binding protein n=1 Tax=Aeromicrobium sp. CTD01-1L150 TaxID=3341830 RepID=UPI0035BFD9F2